MPDVDMANMDDFNFGLAVDLSLCIILRWILILRANEVSGIGCFIDMDTLHIADAMMITLLGTMSW